MVGLKNVATFLVALLPAVSAVPVTDNDSVGKYIVTLKRGLDARDVADHMQFTREVHSRSLVRRGKSVHAWNEGVRHSFKIRDHQSYSAKLDLKTVEEIKSHSAVVSVEATKKIHIWDTATQPLAPWGLGSISFEIQEDYPVQTYRYDESAGEDTWVYVLDTGIRTSHSEFEGRAVGKSFVANETEEDLHGHGTHVAATIGGRTFGVAKKTNLIGLKVLDRYGDGDTEDLLRAAQWVYNDATENNRTSKSVVNLSLGLFGSDTAADEAVKALYEEGLLVVVAAGNDNNDASLYTPASSPYSFTVGAISVNNSRADFSNWGEAVDVFAPGNLILSAGITGDDSFRYMSGTSMAAPHVAGLAAYLKALYGLEKPADVIAKIRLMGLKNAVRDPKGSTNLLAFNGLGAQRTL
ncbi:hypothetical protein DL767_001384 [Monosporascus sp. MG133]|nr:hypothetical protein DL767_001384 [Monosporascus sp. MG133]